MSHGVAILIGLVVLAVLLSSGALIGWLMDRRGRCIVARWALEQDCAVQRISLRLLRRGPFRPFLKGQTVYRVTVLAPDGSTRSGWMRCRSGLSGTLPEHVEVRWDDED